MRIDSIPENYIAKRGIELAIAGNHTINFYGDEGMVNLCTQVVIAHNLIVTENAAINIQVFEPTRNTHNEPDEKIFARIGGMSKEVTFIPSKTSQWLLDKATEQYSYTQEQKQQLINVAKTIAGITKHKEIQLAHLAEAIQYGNKVL